MRVKILGLSIITAISSPGNAQAPQLAFKGTEAGNVIETKLEHEPLRPTVVQTFDVSGLRLGMSFNEANGIAGRRGFRPSLGGHINFNFEGSAWLVANGRLSRERQVDPFKFQSPEHSRSEAKDGTTLKVYWLPTQSGVRLRQLLLTAPSNGTDREAIIASLIAKYGKPTLLKDDGNYAKSKSLFWCSGGEPRCWETEKLPQLQAYVTDASYSLALDGGRNAVDQNTKAIEARAQQLVRARTESVKL